MGFVVGTVHIHPALLEQRLEDAEILAQMPLEAIAEAIRTASAAKLQGRR